MRSGSVAKLIAAALAVDRLGYDLDSHIVLKRKFGHVSVSDRAPFKKGLSLEQLFLRASNRTAATLVDKAGASTYKTFLSRLFQFESLFLGETWTATPEVEGGWDREASIMAATGLGISASPFHFLLATAALVRSRGVVFPTVKKVQGQIPEKRVIRDSTVVKIRHLLKSKVENTSAEALGVKGYSVGGLVDTIDLYDDGTNKGLDSGDIVTSAIAVFPANNPKLAVMTVFERPKPVPASDGYISATHNVAPVTAKIVREVIEAKYGVGDRYGAGSAAHR